MVIRKYIIIGIYVVTIYIKAVHSVPGTNAILSVAHSTRVGGTLINFYPVENHIRNCNCHISCKLGTSTVVDISNWNRFIFAVCVLLYLFNNYFSITEGMKGPTRPAPSVPGMVVSRYSPVTNWNDDPFGADVFEPKPTFAQKKKPPPRPPPPKVSKHPDIPLKPSHFIRRPTVLSSLLSRKNKNTVIQQNATQPLMDVNLSEVDQHKMFPKCDRVNIQMSTLIDLSSPPSSPTFTTRSSSDGVSVDSFGSDATTSTNHQNAFGGNGSQAESGFEDDFDLFLNSRKPLSKEDTIEDFANIDPFSPLPSKPLVLKKPIFSSDSFETSSISSSQYSVPSLKGPTIIRAKPARPRPPDNSALLKITFGSNFQLTSMNVNTTTPIHKISNGFIDNVDTKQDFSWDSSPERESTPPMPTIPPPPPPIITDDDLPVVWPEDLDDDDEPYAIALFDYHTDHREDLCFPANARINLIRRENDEWMYGRLQNGSEGLFPANYVEIKVPLPNGKQTIGQAIALYDFEPIQSGDLGISIGDKITVLSKINEEWHYGECNGVKGQFPANYVQMS